MKDTEYALKEIKFELTYRCLLNCIHCSSEADILGCEMSYDAATDILNQAIRMNVREISFSGGEPLLWQKFPEIASLATSAGIYTQVYSSGNIPDVTIFDEIKTAIRTVIFSIYSADHEFHDRITKVKGSFEKVISAAKKAKQVGLNVEFHFVPLKTNYDHLPCLINYAKTIGVSKISILRFVPQGRGKAVSILALNTQENLNLKKTIETNDGNVQLRTGSPYNFLMVNQNPKCNAGIDRLTITPDLHIYPCDAFKQVMAREIVGSDECSRLDNWSLKDCWSMSPYLEAIRSLHLKPFERPCNNCTLIKSCLSGCMAQKYLAHGRLHKGPDPMCINNDKAEFKGQEYPA